MTQPSKFKLTPDPARPPVDPAKLAAFAAAAEVRPEREGTAPQAPAPKPAEADKVAKVEDAKPEFEAMDDKRRTPAFSMRLTAREAAMLKVISETTPNSMHEFCIKALRQALETHFK